MTDTPKALVLAEELESFPLMAADKAAAELRRLHEENEKLHAALRWHIRVYRVADDAWDQDAEVGRIMALEMKGEK